MSLGQFHLAIPSSIFTLNGEIPCPHQSVGSFILSDGSF